MTQTHCDQQLVHKNYRHKPNFTFSNRRAINYVVTEHGVAECQPFYGRLSSYKQFAQWRLSLSANTL